MIRYIIGLDLGQSQDYTALAVLEYAPHLGGPHEYRVRHLERMPLGTSYPAIVAHVGGLVRKPPLVNATLAVDMTGVGRPVVDMLRNARLPVALYPMTITGGHNAFKNERGEWHVPKKELVSVLQVLLQSQRLKVANCLPEAETLVKELLNFQVKVTLSANETFGTWREGTHDDLVLAVAMAAWFAERPIPGRPVAEPPNSVIARLQRQLSRY